MVKWEAVKLGDYIAIKSGLAYKGSLIGLGNSILLGMGCVSFNDKFVLSGARQYDGDDVEDGFCVNPGEIVLATRQQSDNLPILAMPAIIPDSFENKKIIFGTNLYKVVNNSEISNEFLYWLLKHQHYVNYIAGVKSGTAVQMVTKKNVENYKFLCPSKLEREKIADILWNYENAIDNNNKRIKVLEQMAENLYKEWFVRFRFPGYETAEFENGIPKGWEITRADDVIEFNPTIKAENQMEFRIIPMESLSTNSMLLDESKFEVESGIKGRRSQNGDTLLAKITPCLENGKTGFVARLEDGEVAGGSTEFIVMRSKKLSSYYVYLLARSQYFRQTAILSMNGADGRQRVDEGKIKAMKLPVPPMCTVELFDSFVKPLFDEILHLSKVNQNLIKQRDLLLPRLMSGKLEV